jgi:hypothetical protein
VSGLTSNDSDVENDPFTAQVLLNPMHGRLVVNPDGSFMHSAAPGFVGTDAFYYQLVQNGLPVLQTQQTIPSGGAWTYLEPTVAQGSDAWKTASFDEVGWSSGPTPLGYGYNDIPSGSTLTYADAANKPITYYFRKKFNLPVAKLLVRDLTLRLRRDDGAAIWLNGVEVARDNLPGTLGDGSLTANTLASTRVNQSSADFSTFTISAQNLLDGENILAVELHQAAPDSGDVVMNLALEVNSYAGARVELVIQGDDNDNDGLSDIWEASHSLNLNLNDASTDSDGDGQNNLAEFLAGTSPRNRQSKLQINSLTLVGMQSTLRFPSVTGVRYRIQCSPALMTWSDHGPVFTTTGGPDVSYPLAPAVGCPFYRIRVVPAWEP